MDNLVGRFMVIVYAALQLYWLFMTVSEANIRQYASFIVLMVGIDVVLYFLQKINKNPA